MKKTLASLAGLVGVGSSLMMGGCNSSLLPGAGNPIPVPVASTSTYWYEAATKTLSVQVYGSKDKLSPTSLYVYNVTAVKRGADEFVLSGTVVDGFGAQPMKAYLGTARTTVNLDGVEPGKYKLVDSTSDKVVTVIDTSVPSPPSPPDEAN